MENYDRNNRFADNDWDNQNNDQNRDVNQRRNRNSDFNSNNDDWSQGNQRRNRFDDNFNRSSSDDNNRNSYGSNAGYGNNGNNGNYGNYFTGNANQNRRNTSQYDSDVDYDQRRGSFNNYGNNFDQQDEGFRNGMNYNRGNDYRRNSNSDFNNNRFGSNDYNRRGYSDQNRFGSQANQGGNWQHEDSRQSGYGNSFKSNNNWQNSNDDTNSQGEHRGKGPKDYKRSDDRIREDVCDRLSDDGRIDASNIDVRVSGNEVILSGSVDSKDVKRRAEDVAESVSGVSNVQNQLRVGNRSNQSQNDMNGAPKSKTQSGTRNNA